MKWSGILSHSIVWICKILMEWDGI